MIRPSFNLITKTNLSKPIVIDEIARSPELRIVLPLSNSPWASDVSGWVVRFQSPRNNAVSCRNPPLSHKHPDRGETLEVSEQRA